MPKTYQLYLYEDHEKYLASLDGSIVLPPCTLAVAVDQDGTLIGFTAAEPDGRYTAAVEPLRVESNSAAPHPEYSHAAHWLMAQLESRGYKQE